MHHLRAEIYFVAYLAGWYSVIRDLVRQNWMNFIVRVMQKTGSQHLLQGQTGRLQVNGLRSICRLLVPYLMLVVDVGCFDGKFLRSVESIHSRFGIEIHEASRAKARESGIHLIGTDFAALTETETVFDVVTAFDVIEHTHNPMDFLARLAGVTRENGIVIVSTGNSDAPSWRLLGSRYWYCVIGEHLSFINPNWCAWAAPRVGLELKQIITFSHVNATWWQRIVDVAKNLFYAVFPRGFAWLRKMGLGGEEYRGHKVLLDNPPSWMSAKDHFICFFEKK